MPSWSSVHKRVRSRRHLRRSTTSRERCTIKVAGIIDTELLEYLGTRLGGVGLPPDPYCSWQPTYVITTTMRTNGEPECRFATVSPRRPLPAFWVNIAHQEDPPLRRRKDCKQVVGRRRFTIGLGSGSASAGTLSHDCLVSVVVCRGEAHQVVPHRLVVRPVLRRGRRTPTSGWRRPDFLR